jgi:hypothetical protein
MVDDSPRTLILRGLAWLGGGPPLGGTHHARPPASRGRTGWTEPGNLEFTLTC